MRIVENQIKTGSMKLKILYTLGLSCCLQGLINGQQFTSSLSADTLLIGNDLLVEYTMENVQGQFVAPDLDGMQIVAGPNFSSSTSFINGVQTSSITHSYILRPEAEGDYTLAPAKVITAEGELLTDTLHLHVAANPDGVRVPIQQKRHDMFDLRSWPFGQEEKKDGAEPAKKKTKKRKLKKI